MFISLDPNVYSYQTVSLSTYLFLVMFLSLYPVNYRSIYKYISTHYLLMCIYIYVSYIWHIHVIYFIYGCTYTHTHTYTHISVLREINQPWILIRRTDAIKLKLQYFGHLMETATHSKSPWCWERLRADGEDSIRGWDGWMELLMQQTWTWANFRRWWGTGRPGVLQSTGSQSRPHLEDWIGTYMSVRTLYIQLSQSIPLYTNICQAMYRCIYYNYYLL